MFETSDHARVFGVPPGGDFPVALVSGILERTRNLPPEALARVEIFVNTRRMQRRVLSLFDDGPARLLPRVRLVTDLAQNFPESDIPSAVSPLQRRLELSNLIAALLNKEPDLAPRSALFDLSDSLALLLDEMHDEGVAFENIRNLDVSDRSGHWIRSQKFLKIVDGFTGKSGENVPDVAARQRMIVEFLEHRWKSNPPLHPMIIAGSTGSRGSTSLLMAAVAKLPQGALVLPGFDFDLPGDVWDILSDAQVAEAHPQYRLSNILKNTSVKPAHVQLWNSGSKPPAPARNRLVSLALRPAPVTDQWMQEGPRLKDINQATENLTLIEAVSERQEATAIALILRRAAEEGQTAALVTPDKTLSRRVRAALDRWRIEPDMSAGDALDTTAPGRLFRHVLDLFDTQLNAESLLVLLKHPLVSAAGMDRHQHLTWTRELEHTLRNKGVAFPIFADLLKWAEKSGEPTRLDWVKWFGGVIFSLEDIGAQSLNDHLALHTKVIETLISGPNQVDTSDLWVTPAGKEMVRVLTELRSEAHHAGHMSSWDYSILFLGILRRNEVRDPVRPHPNIMIWGTLESRVQGADLVVLGGLNEGTWPQSPTPDPWLNRQMRLQLGLLVPERQIGLSAHDFQQAVAAKNVVLSRAVRDDEAPSVPSRWVSRLTNLLGGISEDGKGALNAMRRRGQEWLDLVGALESPAPVAPEPRPAPKPPLLARPRSLSVTAISRLIRDPYAIYARNILRLKPLNPLRQQPDARLRGIVLHRILEKFILGADFSTGVKIDQQDLLDIADHVLGNQVPWPTTRLLWREKLGHITETVLKDEVQRQSKGRPMALERDASYRFSEANFTLTGIADRIDLTPNGAAIIYDYKTGKVPTKLEMEHFEKQLFLEAVMLEAGGFKDLHPMPVLEVAHIGLGSNPVFSPVVINPGDIEQVRADFVKLIVSFDNPTQGYASRRAVAKLRYSGDYDHLARYGEWDDAQLPVRIEVDS